MFGFTAGLCFSQKAWKRTEEKNENYALVGYYVAISGNLLPMFWDTLLVPSSGVENPKEKCLQLRVQNQAGNRGH